MIFDLSNPSTLWDIINTGGIIALLLLFIVACHRKWLVFGWQYREKMDELKETRASQAHWQNIALRSTNLVETLAEVSRQNLPPL